MPKPAKNGKTKPQPAPASAVPEYVQSSRLMQRRKVTKRQLPSYTEAMLLLHAPEALRLWWEAVLEGLQRRDKHAMEMAGEVFNYIRGKGVSLNVTQQLFQQNAVAGPDAPVIGCDAFIRQLAEARAGHALPAPEVVDVPAETAPGA